jgi:hypothetical protein
MSIQPEILLREYFQKGKVITRKDNNLFFSADNISLKLDTPTPFIQKSTNKQYTIGVLWFYLNNKDGQLNAYVTNCRKEKIDSVSSLDKPQIVQFFVEGVNDVQIYDKSLIESCKISILSGNQNNITNNSNNTNVLINDLKVYDNNNYNLNDLALEEDPNKRIMQYLMIKEKKTLNRNSLIRIPSLRFDYLLPIAKKTFMKAQVPDQLRPKIDQIKLKNTFLDELAANEGKFNIIIKI